MESFPTFDGCLPLVMEHLRLDWICPGNLVQLRRLEEEEDFQRVTCHPISKWTDGQLLERYQQALSLHTVVTVGLFLPEQDCPIGKLTAGNYNPRNRSAELGYYLVPAYRGNGYMVKALGAFCGVLFQKLGLNKLYTQTGAFNEPSVQLLERVGFRRDGVLRQHHALGGKLWDDHIYSILVNDFKMANCSEHL